MKNATALLAHKITCSSSKQSYYTARLLVDKNLVDDCCRAYGYFRWADDVIDLADLSRGERISFVGRQKRLINQLYLRKLPIRLSPEEEILAELILHDRGEKSRLQSYIYNFMGVLEFDAYRKGQFISQKELSWYSKCIGKAVTDAIQYFVGNEHSYPNSPKRYLAATAAHITHMLRDFVSDLEGGYFNIPGEYLETHEINPGDIDTLAFRKWVQGQVELARKYFREGKCYLNQLDVLRCKIAGYWYCTRFECVLDAIEKDGYLLRSQYNERRKLTTWLRLAKLTIFLTMQHIAHQIFRSLVPNIPNRPV